MFEILDTLTQRPDLFDGFDTAALWTDPHVAKQMLDLHLDDSSELASRTFAEIDAMVEWLAGEVPMAGRKLLDLGCGPGLYAARFQQKGAIVTGLDLSERSIAHARASAIPNARFLVGSYHEAALPPCDIATLIYGDICAMPNAKRLALFARLRGCLCEGGHLILDCFAPNLLSGREEGSHFARNLDGGFWAAGDYFGFRQTFLYPEDTAVLDRYLIIEPSRKRWVHNWLECLTPEQLAAELEEAGFAVGQPKDVVTGKPWPQGSSIFCCIATPR